MIQRLKSKKIWLKVLILIMVSFIFMPNIAQAAPMEGCKITDETKIYKPIRINFPLPNITSEPIPVDQGNGRITNVYEVKNLQCFIIGIYTYFAGVVGILATVMIMYGGVKYLISMGSPQRMSDAKDTIFSAVVGLVLVLGAYMLLNLINPNLTDLKVANIDSIVPTDGFCSAGATPVVEGEDQCGDKGIDVDKKTNCIFSDCSLEMSGAVCDKGQYAGYDAGYVYSDAEVYACVSYKDRCEAIDDSEYRLEQQSTCDPYSVPGKGYCKFIDFDGPHDGCIWLPLINCPNETWSQVDCGECEAQNKDCGEYGIDDMECNADNNDIIYSCDVADDVSLGYGGYQDFRDNNLLRSCREAICCKKMSDPKPNYAVGDLLCSGSSWDWDNEGISENF